MRMRDTSSRGPTGERIVLADRSMIPALKRLWKLCFGDSDKMLELFFEHRFQPEDCAVYLLYGEPAAALYMLPADLSCEGHMYKVQYVYAACTHPRHRQRGLMAELLHFSEIYARLREKDFSVLVPANTDLFAYYGKRGYETFASVRKLRLPHEEACLLSAIRHSYRPLPVEDIFEIRSNCLKNTTALQWDEKAVEYAVHYYTLSGGQLIVIRHTDGSGAYAIYRKVSRTEADIIEILSENGSYAELLHALLEACPGTRTFTINAEINQNIALISGEAVPFGMAKPLSGITIPGSNVYIGLQLD